ncbi:MAG TPA: 30S ribosomal protein S18 [Chloroflexi bacterium]|nr:30S ribosomal protein S18 [Chloroflexota bacterium]HCU97910.1 30S ribosomal protein S18 [Chloroflexota bacterium]|tara:strand:+ start:2898 stop:3149 length:252 start_codon:yes stop_codon:yes gene_type:complete
MAYYKRRNQSFRKKNVVCQFCVNKVYNIDYKNLEVLVRQIGPDGKINPRRRTGTCARHQRMVAVAIKRARHMAMLAFDRGTWL